MQILHRFAGSIQSYSEELSDPEPPRVFGCFTADLQDDSGLAGAARH
ncbi:MAG: hypothetical protein JO307_09005 [Bryobacterales bacterium]|nr:hypothetical protein [Bryobacterales bacterium]MBV9401969.1 hypothetical protein [Bryobacterales bacterium]